MEIEIEGKKLKSFIPSLNIKPWIFWPRNPKLLEELLDTKGILSYQSRSIESIFIGNFENNVQEKYRKSLLGLSKPVNLPGPLNPWRNQHDS